MTTDSRRQRGRESEHIVAARFVEAGFDRAEAVGSAAPGRDIRHVPGYAVEVKARSGLSLPAWLRQAKRNAGQDMPVLITRLNGQGPASVDEWPVILRLGDFMRLIGDK